MLCGLPKFTTFYTGESVLFLHCKTLFLLRTIIGGKMKFYHTMLPTDVQLRFLICLCKCKLSDKRGVGI
jgi:hypothetical protein